MGCCCLYSTFTCSLAMHGLSEWYVTCKRWMDSETGCSRLGQRWEPIRRLKGFHSFLCFFYESQLAAPLFFSGFPPCTSFRKTKGNISPASSLYEFFWKEKGNLSQASSSVRVPLSFWNSCFLPSSQKQKPHFLLFGSLFWTNGLEH